MSISIGVYVDNQEIVQYPVSFLSEYWDMFDYLFWFGSDEPNCNILRDLASKHKFKDRIKVINIGQKVRVPGDIGVAQTKSVAYMVANTDAEYIGYQQADLCLTDVGVDAIKKGMMSISGAFAIAAEQNKLYCETWHNPNGLTIMHRSCRYLSPADGWTVHIELGGVSASPPTYEETDPNNRFMLDLGYMSSDAYYRKLINHAKIWPDFGWKHALKAQFDINRMAGIKAALRHVSNHDFAAQPPTIVKSLQYKYLCDRFGLHEDYWMVNEAIKQVFWS